MLLLAGANDKFQLITSAAGDIDTVASFMDASTADPPVVKGSTSAPQVATITTATTTDIVAAPGASVIRSVSSLSIRNVHATIANDVTVQLDRSGTDYEIFKTNLLPGDILTYEDGLGWFKTAASDPWSQYVRKGTDQTFSAANTLADITGMGFAVVANATYELEFDIIWQSATLTVGGKLAINGPASPTSVQGTITMFGGAAATSGAPAAFAEMAFWGFTAYDSGPLMASIQPINSNLIVRMNCLLEVGGTAGTITPRWTSETATNTFIKAGSYGTCKRLK